MFKAVLNFSPLGCSSNVHMYGSLTLYVTLREGVLSNAVSKASKQASVRSAEMRHCIRSPFVHNTHLQSSLTSHRKTQRNPPPPR